MNIAIFASAFYPSVGGVEELCRQLAMEYQRRGFGVVVLTNRWPRELPVVELIDGIEVHRFAMRVPTRSVKSKISFALTSGSVGRDVVRLLRKFKADVLHVQCVGCTAVYALAARQELNLPLVVSLQGELTMDASQVFQREAWAKQVMRQSLEKSDAITACSKQTLAEAEAWLGQPFGPPSKVIYNGIASADAEVEPWPHPRPYVLAIGRHVVQKAFDVLLRAMATLLGQPAFAHDLILAGDGTEHAKLRKLASELGLGKRVIFTGRVDHSTAMRLFGGCSFFVLPSKHEPFGIVNLEAMAASVAIVATRVGGVPEILTDGHNGLLVPAADVEALAKAILRLATDAELRQRLGAAGRSRALGFIWPVIADQYTKLYREMLDGDRTAARSPNHLPRMQRRESSAYVHSQ